jgi:hypothetical protein
MPDGTWLRVNVARLRYDTASMLWTLHWSDSNSRWHPYEFERPTKHIERLLAEIDEDPTCIFFG